MAVAAVAAEQAPALVPVGPLVPVAVAEAEVVEEAESPSALHRRN